MTYTYTPKPLDTQAVELSGDLLDLVEQVSAHIHDIWARQRIAEGWSHGPQRDDVKKTHPDLVPYDELSDSEKEYDRNSVKETLQAVIALGFSVQKQ